MATTGYVYNIGEGDDNPPIKQSVTYELEIAMMERVTPEAALTPITMEGTIHAQIRPSVDSTTAETFDTSLSDLPNGIIHLELTPEQTERLIPNKIPHVYDVLHKDLSGKVTEILSGTAKIEKNVTVIPA